MKRQSTFTRTRPTLVFALRGHHRNDVRLCDHGARSNLRFRERTAWHFRERSAWHFRQPVECHRFACVFLAPILYFPLA